MPDFQDSAYILENDLKRFRHTESGEGYDLEAFSFDGVTQVRQAHQDKVLDLPNPTFFYQHKCPEYLNKVDSLNTLEGCPIFSQKMIDVLLSVREFSYRKYPIAVIEERGSFRPYEDVDKFKKLSLRNDLFIFQTLEFLDVFDWEKSNYEQDDYDVELNVPTYIRQFVLKTPDGGFPPLFHLPPLYTVTPFVSRDAREALRKAGITGNSFTQLSKPRGNSEIDVLVEEIRDLKLESKIEKHQKKIDKVFTRAEKERQKGNDDLADRLEQEAHDLMRSIGS